MTPRQRALRAAAGTRALAGKEPRLLRVHLLVALALVPALGGIPAHAFLPDPLVLVAFLAVSVGALVAILLWQRAAVKVHNDAYAAALAGDDDRAEQMFRALLARPTTEQLVAYALYHLATISGRRGDVDGAAALLRASVEVERTRFLRTTGSIEQAAAAEHAVALTCAGKLDDAEAALAPPSARGEFPYGVALMARSRALVALRRGKPEEAIAVLDAERALLRNALTANDDALVQAILAVALSRLGGAYRNAPRAQHPVEVDAEARAYVTRILPESEPLLAGD
jgi:tetratricopeptide (TPR) repeat protein